MAKTGRPRKYFTKEDRKAAVRERLKNLTPEQRQRRRDSYARYRNRHPVRELLKGAKKRAKKSGLEFSITEADLQPVPEFCPVFGIRLKYGANAGHLPECPSIDRIDNSQGYIPGNVIIVSYRANTLKRDATIEELVHLGQFYGSFQCL